jgi:hypothetical protein
LIRGLLLPAVVAGAAVRDQKFVTLHEN